MTARQNNYVSCHWLGFVVRQVPERLGLPCLRLSIYAGVESSQMCILGGDSQDQCGEFRLPLQASPFLQNITAMINPSIDAQGTDGRLSGPCGSV